MKAVTENHSSTYEGFGVREGSFGQGFIQFSRYSRLPIWTFEKKTQGEKINTQRKNSILKLKTQKVGIFRKKLFYAYFLIATTWSIPT